ncbi:hypothetical protein, partial [Streptomyces hilarionis]|uniref:hypothetical protein n=1 Tax=Streptomyces hilarionis TaxID=2839954 RepID=UPI00211A9D1F
PVPHPRSARSCARTPLRALPGLARDNAQPRAHGATPVDAVSARRATAHALHASPVVLVHAS